MRTKMFFVLLLQMSLLQTMFAFELKEPQTEVFAILKKCCKQLYDEYGLQCFGIGGRTSPEIYSLSTRFIYSNKLDISSARKMIIMGIKIIQSRLNQDLRIRPYLHDYPVKIENLKFSITVRNDTIWPRFGKVASACTEKDKLIYSTYNPETDELETLYIETYEDALKEVKGERND